MKAEYALIHEKWKKDLEERLARYLFMHPENGKPLPEVRAPRIVVRESGTKKGDWVVISGGVTTTFEGSLAHLKATRYANNLANTPCGFCGGYLVHRNDCPDCSKDGPTFPET